MLFLADHVVSKGGFTATWSTDSSGIKTKKRSCLLSVGVLHIKLLFPPLKFLSLLQDVEELSMLIQAPSNLPIILRISQPILNVPGPSSPMMETI